MEKKLTWKEPGREELELDLVVENAAIQSLEMKAIGCLDFLNLSQKMKAKLVGPIANLLPPSGIDHSSMIWREMISTIQETWTLPIEDEELCHCRKISTAQVDRAVVYGAHTLEEIRSRTSANTGCGTCKNDVILMIENRKKIS